MNMEEHEQSVYCELMREDPNSKAKDNEGYLKEINKFFPVHPCSSFGGRRLFVQLAEVTLGYLCGALEKDRKWKFSKIERLPDIARITGKTSVQKQAIM
jgi:hypothetical protein